MTYPALQLLMRTPRLPVVDWTDAPADLNGLARFAERRSLVSARVPSHFNWPLPVLVDSQACLLCRCCLCVFMYQTSRAFVSYYHGDNSKQNLRMAVMLPNINPPPQVHVYFLLPIIMYQCYGWLLQHEGWGLGVYVVRCNRNERRGLPCFLIEVW